jgi:GNAT superfamily N-acetyltransferase
MCELTFIPVRNLWDAMRMRQIRNECRKYMTHCTRHISIWGQMKWYFCTYKRMLKHGYFDAWLGWWRGVPVVYGSVWDSSVTGGVRKKYRGKGFGEQLFKHLTDKAGKMACLEVWEWNEVAQSLYKKLGYKEIRRENKVVYMNLGFPGTGPNGG